MLDIVIFALLAGFIAFRLYSVLGQNDEDLADEYHAKPGNRRAQEADSVMTLSPQGNNEEGIQQYGEEQPICESAIPAVMDVFKKLHSYDSSFNEARFMTGAKAAFEIIVESFAAGDKETLEPLLTRDLFKQFASEIDSRSEKEKALDTTIIAMPVAEITNAHIKGKKAFIEVKFVTEQVTVTRNSEGEVISGDPSKTEKLEDVWIFSRPVKTSDPSWQLVETRNNA